MRLPRSRLLAKRAGNDPEMKDSGASSSNLEENNSFAIKITDNVWEFASGPHNSNNHWSSDEGDRPANGRFQYGPRPVDIRWSTYFRPDIPRFNLRHLFTGTSRCRAGRLLQVV